MSRFVKDGVSQMAHIIGGVCGGVKEGIRLNKRLGTESFLS